jgi:hypothetical protein
MRVDPRMVASRRGEARRGDKRFRRVRFMAVTTGAQLRPDEAMAGLDVAVAAVRPADRVLAGLG